MTTEQLDELQSLCSRANLPWAETDEAYALYQIPRDQWNACVAMVNSMPELIARVRELEAELAGAAGYNELRERGIGDSESHE